MSTRTLFLGSGNNVGPVRDLLRRVLVIRLDPKAQSPATLQYEDSPVERVLREVALPVPITGNRQVIHLHHLRMAHHQEEGWHPRQHATT